MALRRYYSLLFITSAVLLDVCLEERSATGQLDVTIDR